MKVGNLEKLREVVMELARSKWGTPLSAAKVTHLERCLLEAFPVARTPTHPTYALMILTALEKLGPSTQDSVIEFIKANFEDLPWAHRSFTRHHLNQLCEKGSIMYTVDKRYVISDLCLKLNSSRPSSLHPDRKWDRGLKRIRADDIDDVEEENIKVTWKRNPRRARHMVISDDEDEPGEVGTVLGDENLCANGEFEIQVNRVCHTGDNGVEKSEEGAQVDLQMKEFSVTGGAQGVLDERMFKHKHELIEPIKDQLFAVKRQEEMRSDMRNVSDPKLLEEPGKAKSSRGRKRKEVVENQQIDAVIVCGLPTESQKQDKESRKSSRKRAKLEQKQQLMKLPHHDSPPSSELSEVNENDSLDLGMPLALLKKNTTSNREKNGAVGLEKRNWLIGVQSLVQTSFFHQCKLHEGYGCHPGRTKCNWFCFQCVNEAFCSLCLENHIRHPVVKVNRSVYEDCLDVQEAKSVNLDLSGIERHTVNRSSVVSLSRDMKSRLRKSGETKPCICCERRVYCPFEFCSLRCKNKKMMDEASSSFRNSQRKTSMA